MKKIFIAITLCILTNHTYAQIGVNTSDVTSTLTVNGSISGKYIEVKTSQYQIQGDDYNIAYTGGNEDTAVFTLPEVKKRNFAFAGRTYYIKNLTKNKKLQINAYPNQTIRFGGTPNNSNQITLAPGRYIMIIANDSPTNASWDVNVLGMSEEIRIPEIKTLEYIRKTVPLNNSTTTASTLKIGNLQIRFNYQDTRVQGTVQYMVETGEHTSVWFSKTGTNLTNNSSTNRIESCLVETPLKAEQWSNLCGQSIAGTDLLNIYSKDVGTAYITLHNKQEIYRVTTAINNKINKNTILNIPEVPALVTLFVEKLD